MIVKKVTNFFVVILCGDDHHIESKDKKSKKFMVQQKQNSPNAQPQTTSPDTFLACLSFIATYYKKQFSQASLVAGLPLREGRLTPSLFVRAARRIGLHARVVDRKFEQLSPYTCPFVALTQENQAVVVTELDGENKKISYHDTATDKTQTIPHKRFSENIYGGSIILAHPANKAERVRDVFNTGKDWFWASLKQFKRLYGQVALASVFTNLLALAIPLFIMNVYDRVVPNEAMATLWALALLVIISFVFDFLFRQLRGYFVDVAGRGADILLASRLFQQILGVRLGQKLTNPGALANQMREYESLRDFFSSATLVTVVDMPFVLLFVAIIALLNPLVALVPLVAIPIIFFLSFIAQRPVRKLTQQVQEEMDRKHGYLVEAISGLETIKAHNLNSRMQAVWEQSVGATARVGMASRFYAMLGVNISVFFQQIVTVMVVIVGVYQIKDGAMSVGGLIACTLLTGRVMAPITQAASLYARFEQSALALQGLDNIMAMTNERPEGKQFVFNNHYKGGVAFKDVYFHYPDSQINSLQDVSFRIQPGEKVGLIGRTGSGKSTVAKLILNLYNPQAGSVLLDNIEIRQQDPATLRDFMAYVPQTVQLFNTSLKENIMMVSPNATPEQFEQAALHSGVAYFGARHPMGYDMPLGRGGDGVSGGQKQSVALARAFLQPRKLMVLDEPTNGLDPNTEKAVLKNIQAQVKDQTLILITHKSALLALVDRLIVFDGGRIVADGKKEDVLKKLNAGTKPPKKEGE